MSTFKKGSTFLVEEINIENNSFTIPQDIDVKQSEYEELKLEDLPEYIELIDLWKMRISMASDMERIGALLKVYSKEYEKLLCMWNENL